MSIASQSTWGGWQPPPFPVRQFSVDEYHRMIEAGVLTEDDPVELLEGWIAPKMPRNPLHDATIELAHSSLAVRLPAGWRVRVQSAITTSDSEPEPDLAVVRGTVRSHASRHPSPSETALVVEASESSLTHDRDVKGRLYARAQIPVFWIINLQDRCVEVYSNPSSGDSTSAYLQRQDFGFDGAVPFSVDGKHIGDIPVAELIP